MTYPPHVPPANVVHHQEPTLPPRHVVVDNYSDRVEHRDKVEKALATVAGSLALIALLLLIGSIVVAWTSTRDLETSWQNDGQVICYRASTGIDCLPADPNGKILKDTGKQDTPPSPTPKG
jgi:hypothetical protein